MWDRTQIVLVHIMFSPTKEIGSHLGACGHVQLRVLSRNFERSALNVKK